MAKTFQGAACEFGHTERYVSNRNCVACSPLRERLRRRDDPEKVRVAHEKWRNEHRERTREVGRRSARKTRAAFAPEIKAEEHLVESVEMVGGMCPKFVDPSRRGAPDRMVLLPEKPVIFVEMKREKLGKVKIWQERYHADLRALGHRVEVLWSKSDVDRFLASI
jgi:hypothetical protein